MRAWVCILGVVFWGSGVSAHEFEVMAVEKNGTLGWDGPCGMGAQAVEWAFLPCGAWRSRVESAEILFGRACVRNRT